MGVLENHFKKFRKNTIGYNQKYCSPYGKKKLIYADWIASGRLYAPIENRIAKDLGPFVANTHTETSETGTCMTHAYHKAHKLIKQHVNANEDDVIITAGFGMTAVANKLQRILGIKGCQMVKCNQRMLNEEKPVVFITHMEHHSNQTSWYETFADVEVVEPDKDLLVDLNDLKEKLKKYSDRKFKIGSFTACSNVTGIKTPFYEMAKIMHQHGGVCFIDFAASAPYVEIDMHPSDPMESLDAIFFSPHKFLGGPGSSGVLIFNKELYKNPVPDHPGGGTVDWTNPWGNYKYLDDIEAREDGGTPGFLQAIRTALCIEVKNQMDPKKIEEREKELVSKAFNKLRKIPRLKILADNIEDRLGIISFYLEDTHYNMIVKLLSDRFGIQVRGGCACAGTYGHYLLDVSYEFSKEITDKINKGDLSDKPGWVRLSLHPTMTDKELDFVIEAISEIEKNYNEWKKDYAYDKHSNEFSFNKKFEKKQQLINSWFKF